VTLNIVYIASAHSRGFSPSKYLCELNKRSCSFIIRSRYPEELQNVSSKLSRCVGVQKLLMRWAMLLHCLALTMLFYAWTLVGYVSYDCAQDSTTLYTLISAASTYSILWALTLILGSRCRRKYPVGGELYYPSVQRTSSTCCCGCIDLQCTARLQRDSKPRCCLTFHQICSAFTSPCFCCGCNRCLPRCCLEIGECWFQYCLACGASCDFCLRHKHLYGP
jgi:hypothetical protein